jgi:hypothetical protein
MANKQKKKRNKSYQGADAAISRPTVTRIKAENRSKLKQWWLDHKRIVRPVAITIAIIAVIVILIVELVRIANA